MTLNYVISEYNDGHHIDVHCSLKLRKAVEMLHLYILLLRLFVRDYEGL